MTQIDAADIFIENDGEGEDGPNLISVRVPQEREFARQIKELGAKWDDQSKEWRLYGDEDLLKKVADLCKSVFPRLPRRRNRLIAGQLSIKADNNSWVSSSNGSSDKAQTKHIELVAEVQFVANRTFKNYRTGQNLKWVKEYKHIIEVPYFGDDEDKDALDTSSTQQKKFATEIMTGVPELERTATEAFEALLAGKKEAVKAILREAGIEQR